jgi:gliding motility-associated-like protein
LTQADADSGENPLPLIYTNETNPQTIYVRVKHVRLDFCIATTSFPIFVGRQPVISDSTVYFVCEGETTVISAEQGYDAYEWITGETTAQIVVSEPGTYSVMIKNNYQDFSCDINQEIQVIGSSIATIIEVISTDWTSEENSIMINVSGTGNYQYSLDGFQFQNSPFFTSLPTGLFTVYVKDLNGCGVVSEEVLLLYYPNFFTPNGDGDNDTWRIKFSAFERQLNIKIYDRYGKFIYNLDPNSTGWDGTYNGNPLPSTDYWFVVTRANGKIHKGHFALKR